MDLKKVQKSFFCLKVDNHYLEVLIHTFVK